MSLKKENLTLQKCSNMSMVKNIDADIEKYENEAKQMLSRMELTLKDLRQLNTESDPNKRFEVFLHTPYFILLFYHILNLFF